MGIFPYKLYINSCILTSFAHDFLITCILFSSPHFHLFFFFFLINKFGITLKILMFH